MDIPRIIRRARRANDMNPTLVCYTGLMLVGLGASLIVLGAIMVVSALFGIEMVM